jgi:hypothetical protein
MYYDDYILTSNGMNNYYCKEGKDCLAPNEFNSNMFINVLEKKRCTINSVLTSLPMFMLSFFETLKGVLEKIDYFRLRFSFGIMIVKRKNID